MDYVAVSAGANNVNNIYFSLSNQKSEEMKNSLLKDAIDSARIKADIAANAAGLKVIGVKSIIVGEAGSSPPVRSTVLRLLMARQHPPHQ